MIGLLYRRSDSAWHGNRNAAAAAAGGSPKASAGGQLHQVDLCVAVFIGVPAEPHYRLGRAVAVARRAVHGFVGTGSIILQPGTYTIVTFAFNHFWQSVLPVY